MKEVIKNWAKANVIEVKKCYETRNFVWLEINGTEITMKALNLLNEIVKEWGEVESIERSDNGLTVWIAKK